jgi:NADH-quinone oxidoreductase subunit J
MSFADGLAYVLGAGALVSALNVVLRRDAVIAAMYLVLAFFCLSGVYLLLGFPFLATLQVLVYAGAIMVLFLFVIMLLGVTRIDGPGLGLRTGIGGVIALAAAIEGSVIGLELARPPAEPRVAESMAGIAALLFRDTMVLPFEIAGVLLLASMVAVVVLARRVPDARGAAELARERAFDPRRLVASPPPTEPDGLEPSDVIFPLPPPPAAIPETVGATPDDRVTVA